jgi:glycosyltransferase involved in cell wall biosynthesis
MDRTPSEPRAVPFTSVLLCSRPRFEGNHVANPLLEAAQRTGPQPNPASVGHGQALGRTPHVVLFRPYDLQVDSRAKKIAQSLARLGYRVTVLALAKDGAARVARLGPVHVELVPVAFRVRDANAQRRNVRRAWRPKVAPVADEITARRLRARVRRRELLAQRIRAGDRVPGALTLLVAAWFAGRRSAVSGSQRLLTGRLKLQNAVNHQIRRGWRLYDTQVKKVRLGSSWRRWLPEVYDYEIAFSGRLAELEPDIIHVHDPKVLGVVTNVAQRLRSRGREVKVVYDARENFAGLPEKEWGSPRYHETIVSLEADHIRQVDRVVTVSDPIAEELQRRFCLSKRPGVVLNVPVWRSQQFVPRTTVREAAHLDRDVPLVVYSGGLSHARGADVLVRAMGLLPGAHLAMVTVPYPHPMTPGLLAAAEQVGAQGRVHVLPPVETAELIPFLAAATVAVHPMPGGSPNHDMALPNKLFEYLHAGLPLVVSDAKEIARFVSSNRVGESFRSGDHEDLARALSAVLANRDRYIEPKQRRELVRRYSWQGQEAELSSIYADVAPPLVQTDPTCDFPALDLKLDTVPEAGPS